jgi:hypothetical protein
LGKDTNPTDGEKAITNGVRVTLMHNSLATMGTSASLPSGSQPATGVSNPDAVTQ